MIAPAPSADLSQQKIVRLRTAPLWLPEKFRKREKRIRLQFRPLAGERRLFRKRKPIAPSVWAPKYRIVTYGPLAGSRWDNSFMPHFRGIMDASFFPSVKIIGNCKAPQTGSSAGVETIIGYIADMQPGPAFIVYPDRDTTAKRSTDYLQPMFTRSPRLWRLMTGVSDDLASLRINLMVMLIYMGWAGSVTSLGNISARYLVGDEIDKWPTQPSKKEPGALNLFFERFRAYKYGAKAWISSTPTTPSGPIWNFLKNEAQVVFDYHLKCPDCGHMELIEFKRIKWPEDQRDPRKIIEGKLAYYACSHCGATWDDRKRDKASQGGIWFARDDGRELFAYLRAERPAKICFHSPAWISQLVSLSEAAAWFLKGLKNKKDMHFFDTQIRAEPHIDYETQRQEDQIMILADDRPPGLVPDGNRVAALVAGVDTQDDGFYFEIRAFGWGIEQESWQVRFGFIQSFEALQQILFIDNYRDKDGLYYSLHLAVQDAMGHRTGDVYDFARSNPGRLQPYKGGAGRRSTPMTYSTVDRYPGTSKVIPGGVRLVTCDTHFYKDNLATKLRINPDSPGAWHMHSGLTAEFAQHLCAEYVDERQLWQCPKNKPNHYWDCSFMALIAADILQIKYWQKDTA